MRLKIEIWLYATVCFISTVTFHDNVAPKVLKIIQFCKKYLKDNTLAFNVHQFLGLFDKNWTLLSHSQLDRTKCKKCYFILYISEVYINRLLFFFIIYKLQKNFSHLRPIWHQQLKLFENKSNLRKDSITSKIVKYPFFAQHIFQLIMFLKADIS